MNDNKNNNVMNDWISIRKELPPVDVPVKVLLTNGIEAIDYVNSPFNKENPFQHYLVSKWRPATEEELEKYEAEKFKARGLSGLIQDAAKKLSAHDRRIIMQCEMVKNKNFGRE